MGQDQPTAKRAVVVFGSGRSGTTWISDMLASCRGCIAFFEPLRAERSPQVPRWGASSDLPGPMVPVAHDCSPWEEYLNSLFSGGVRNGWVRQDHRRVPDCLESVPLVTPLLYRVSRRRFTRQEAKATTRVFKMIRGNLLVPWMLSRFSVDPVYVLRHPCAVVGSRLRLGWSHGLENVLAQGGLREELRPWMHLLKRANTQLEKTAALWCVENLLPLRMVASGELRPYFYERFVKAPRREFSQAFRHLGLSPGFASFQRCNKRVSSPSNQSRSGRPWHHPLSRAEGETVLSMARAFGIDVYGRSGLPRRGGVGLVNAEAAVGSSGQRAPR